MKVLICGSRRLPFDSRRVVKRVCDLEPGTLVMTGGATGADDFGNTAARACGLPTQVFPANWKVHGKRAGILRNLEMLDQQPDLVIAFWDGKSPGTRHTIKEAKRRGIPVEIHTPASSMGGEHETN